MIKEERVFDMSLFKEYLKSKLIALLDSIPGKKLLMLDPSVRNPINLLERKLLFEHGVVEQGGILGFESINISNNFNQIVIFLPPNVKSMETLVNLYEKNRDRGNKTYYAVFWPKRSAVCKEYLQTRGMLSSFTLRDFSFDLIPIDHDLYSLEIKCFKQLFVDHEFSIYNLVAESIHRLQCVFGRVRNIFGKGSAARNVYDILGIKQNQIKIDDIQGDIEHLIILDRSIDLVTPLLKQMTYEGMIDELYGINCNYVKLPVDLLDEVKQKKFQNQNPYKTIALNGDKDYVFEEVRILNINTCRKILKNKAMILDSFQEEAKVLKDVTKKKDATKRITVEKEYLKNHINISSALAESMKTISFHKDLMMMQRCIMGSSDKEILEYAENMIPFGLPLEKLMRSICLYSLVEKGVPKKIYRSMCSDIVQCYGPESIVSLTNMSRLGLFCEQGVNPTPFAEVRKQLKLINEQPINHENPTDVAFAYGGYAPVSVKLVEHVLRSGWKNIAKGLKMLPGETLMPDNVNPCTSSAKPVVLVYFIGGVTYGEVAALRLLGKMFKREMVVATTEIINSDSMLRSLVEKIE